MSDIKHKVLIVEDETYILKVLMTLLTANDYKVITAGDAATAKIALNSHQPEIILLDLGLPDMDGAELLKEIRNISKIPVIVVSARNMEKDKIQALDNGADDYIEKPFSAPELLARMRAALRRNMPVVVDQDSYSVRGFLIDFSKRSVYVDDELIKLTQTEYKIVELIARHPGKVLTYGYIINNVWGPYADQENNRILRVNMSNIRRKIEKDSMSPSYILTDIGVGYRMAEL